MRHYNWIDQIINRFEDALEIINPGFNKNFRPTPKSDASQTHQHSDATQTHQHSIDQINLNCQTLNLTCQTNQNSVKLDNSNKLADLTEREKKLSLACLRVNHSGEVAAQALYLGQAMAARDAKLAEAFKEAANEEKDHLAWCKERILQLQGKTSYFNPIWAAGSFAIGFMAGFISDKISLGFLAETENQVIEHLDSHLAKISSKDIDSRAILLQMRADEAKHATMALKEGGIPLPTPVKKLMKITAKIMTTTSFYI